MHVNFKTKDPAIIHAVNTFINEWKSSSEYVEVFTSGSTGTPKLITLKKEYMRNSAVMTGAHLSLKQGGSALLCLSPNTIAGKMMIVRSLVLNLHLIVVTPSSFPLESIQEPIDFAAMVPLQVHECLDRSPESIQSVKTLLIGGGEIHPSLAKSIAMNHPNAYQSFGMTETISHIALRKIKPHSTAYETLNGITVSEKDGQLVINAPSLGVQNLITNDIVRLDNSHQFEWLGRKDFVINSGGIKIHPEQIEQLLSDWINEPYFVAGLPDEKLGSKLILCIEKPIDVKYLLAILREKFHGFQRPKEVYSFSNFERTESGKINRLQTLKIVEHVERAVL